MRVQTTGETNDAASATRRDWPARVGTRPRLHGHVRHVWAVRPAESIATIHAALDAGVTLLDTGDFYGMGHNEMLIGEALKAGRREQAQLSVKFGALRDPAGGWTGYDARPAAVKNFLAYTLQRLGVDYIDIYRPARLDPEVPIEDTVGAIAEHGEGGLRAPYRPVRSGRGDDPPRRGGASDLRSADRVFADLTRHRRRHPGRLPRPRHRHHRLWRAVTRADQRALVQGGAGKGRFPCLQSALPGRQRRPQPGTGRGAAAGRGRPRASVSRNWRSPGWRHRATTSCR